MSVLLTRDQTDQQCSIRKAIAEKAKAASANLANREISVDAPRHASKFWVTLYELFPGFWYRRVKVRAWLTETTEGDRRGLGISNDGVIIATFITVGNGYVHRDWAVVGPHMPLTDHEHAILSALADDLATGQV